MLTITPPPPQTTLDTGTFSWTIPDSITPGSYQIEIIRKDQAESINVSAFSNAFQIWGPVNTFYVSTTGSDAANGLAPESAKPSIAAILQSYILVPGDTILVAAGNYSIPSNIVLSAAEDGIIIEGAGSTSTILDRSNVNPGSYVFDVSGSTRVTVADLEITGAYDGVYSSSCDQLTLSGDAFSGDYLQDVNASGQQITVQDSTFSSDDNCAIDINGDQAAVVGNTVTSGYAEGINVTGYNAVIANNAVQGPSYGIGLSYGNGGQITGNVVSYDYDGIDMMGGDPVYVAGNIAYSCGTGIYGGGAGGDQTPELLVGPAMIGVVSYGPNTVYGCGTGIYLGANETATGNVVYGNSTGIQLYADSQDPATARSNQVYDNSAYGILAVGNCQLLGNTVYSNGVGISAQGRWWWGAVIENNLLYANTSAGIQVENQNGAQLTNNTVYQIVGDAVQVSGSAENVTVLNNILWTQAGYDLNVASDSQQGFTSDYNDLYATAGGQLALWGTQPFAFNATDPLIDWQYDLNFDRHSLAVDPRFVNSADENFQVAPGSLTIDAGDPSSPYMNEPQPNGGRVNLGYTGNTSQALASAAQTLQWLNPVDGAKLQQGQQVTLQWHSSGLTAQAPVALIDCGGGAVGSWSADTYQTTDKSYNGSFSNSVDTSGVSDPAPQAVYQSYAAAQYGGELDYALPVPDGTYTLRLDFVEPGANPYCQRVFDILVNGQTVQSEYDIYAAAGGNYKATSLSFTVTASGGTGLALELLDDNNYNHAIVSGIELWQANPAGFSQPTADINLSSDGGTTWTTIASGVPLDALGNGSYTWTVPADLPAGNDYRLQVVSDNAPGVQAISAPFLVANGGDDYYVAATGNNANSGKDPSQPMASLAALVNAYPLGPGDTIYVAAGTYNLLGNLEIPSGVTVIGAGNTATILDRGNTNPGSYVFDVSGSTGVAVEDLGITGAYDGVYGSSCDQVTLSNDAFSGNYLQDVNASGQQITVQDSTFSGDDWWNSDAIDINGDQAAVVGNTVTSGYAEGINVTGYNAVIANNAVQGPSYGISLSYGNGGQITGNVVSYDYDGIDMMGGDPVYVAGNIAYSCGTGIYGGGAGGDQTPELLVGPAMIGVVSYGPNTVYGCGTGIYLGANETATGNVVYGNSTGIQLYADSQDPATARSNQVYDNSAYGILAVGNCQLLGNTVYSNGVGISAQGRWWWGAVIENNLLYANTSAGIQVENQNGAQLTNNTVYQIVGDAVQVSGSAENVTVLNNILWTQAGYDLNVASDSQQGFTSDYNLFFLGSNQAIAHLGFWNGTPQQSFADWQAASGQDADSLFANPDFVDPAGADGILGYTTAGGGYNGGDDDNFSLSADSPAIGNGTNTDAPPTDITGDFRNPGAIDIGAYAFLGSILNTTPPAITGSTPSVVNSSCTTSIPFDQLQLALSEPLNPIDANAPAAFQLLGSGDTDYTLLPQYTPGSTTLTIAIDVPGGGDLPSGNYQFTVFGAVVHDLSGLELAGDGQTAGTNYVRTFSIQDQQTTTSVASDFGSGSIYGQTITLSATVAAVSGTPSGTVQFFADGSDLGSPAVLVNGTASISLSTLPAGNDAITAAYTSDSSGYADSATDPGNPLTQVVSPAPLTITANKQVMVYGGTIPTLTASYTGFVNGDTSASLTTPPNLTTTATPSSPVGSYEIDASGAVDPNYNISYVKGTLIVATAPVVSAMLVENGLTERSYVDQLTFEFNKPMVSTAAVPMTLTDFGTQGTLDQSVALTASQFQWTTAPGTGASVLTWSLESFAGGTSSLPDGYYQLTLPNGLITDPTASR